MILSPKTLSCVSPIEEKSYINNVLTVHTVISVLIFLIYFFLNSLAGKL